jgi:hypothetical protein
MYERCYAACIGRDLHIVRVNSTNHSRFGLDSGLYATDAGPEIGTHASAFILPHTHVLCPPSCLCAAAGFGRISSLHLPFQGQYHNA